MNTEALFLFLILLLGLLLSSFLGNREGFSGNNSEQQTQTQNNSVSSSSGASTTSKTHFDNYNHFTGASSQSSPGTTFYGDNNATAKVILNRDGTQSLEIVLPGSSSPVTFNPKQQNKEAYSNLSGTADIYYGPNGAKAVIINTNDGQQAVKVTTKSKTYYYYTSGTGTNQNTTNTSTQYYGSTGSSIQQAPYDMSYGGSAGAVTGPQGNTAYYAQGPQGNAITGTMSSSSPPNDDYYNSLPPGIPRSQIPAGQEDLYILKSQVVPPVCPACPVSATIPRQEPCPACPPCARCPEPSFECKKVPNYNAINNDYLPAPVLSDFSQFGM